MKVLITGGSGFIGSNLIHLLRRERPSWRLVNLDLLTYAANSRNLAGIVEDSRYRFVRGDIADRLLVADVYRRERFDAVIHIAAETHVDRSIDDGGRFLRTNVEGTIVLLEAAMEFGPLRHVQIGTDEVYGSLEPAEPPFTERTPMSPRSPYSASKAAADHLALAFYHTHALDVVVTRCSNNYGPFQHPEKMVPLMIAAAQKRAELPVYGDGRQRRDWIHVEDHCRGLLAALEHGRQGHVYNLGGEAERENIVVIERILELLGGDRSLIRYVTDRPGHDRRYAMDCSKAKAELGWAPRWTFEDGLRTTVEWYLSHTEWWRETAADAYRESQRRLEQWAAAQAAAKQRREAELGTEHATTGDQGRVAAH